MTRLKNECYWRQLLSIAAAALLSLICAILLTGKTAHPETPTTYSSPPVVLQSPR